MPKSKKKAYPMSADKIMKRVFHPKVHKHVKAVVERANKPKNKLTMTGTTPETGALEVHNPGNHSPVFGRAFFPSLFVPKFLTLSIFFCGAAMTLGNLVAQSGSPDKSPPVLNWHDVSTWGVEGRGWSEGLENYYDRLPIVAKNAVGEGIWNFSRDSSGMSVRFATDATEIDVRYRLNSAQISAFSDVSNVATSGVDLYVQMPDPASVQEWRWAGSNKPNGRDVVDVLAHDMAPGRRLYQIYLPVYNGVEKFEIGVPFGASFETVAPRAQKPILFYGTSITQGGVASRPGLAFPSILGRRLDRPIIDLGFCGYGKMEPELADLIAGLDPAVFVIDALQNMQPPSVAERAEPFIRRLRQDHPKTPILLVGFAPLPSPSLFPAETARREKLNSVLRSVYDKLVAAGDKNLHYLSGENLLGSDGEATGEGLHPNAIGMLRYADSYEPVLRKILDGENRQ